MFTLLMAAVIASAPCNPIPGVQHILSRPETRIIWIGEMHGTAEQPALFADIVCAVSKARRPIVVALERDRSEQPVWDRFLSSDGGLAARAALLKFGDWTSDTQDGRSSVAMLALANRLREYKQAGLISGVVLVVDSSKPTASAEAYEMQMAQLVRQAGGHSPSALIMAYSGSAHASRATVSFNGVRYREAASHLPRSEVVAVKLYGDPGMTWACEETTCGPHSYPPGWSHRPRGLSLRDLPDGFDAAIYTGRSTSASPPAARPSTPEPIPKF